MSSWERLADPVHNSDCQGDRCTSVVTSDGNCKVLFPEVGVTKERGI